MMDTRVWNAQNFSIMSVIKHNCCLGDANTHTMASLCTHSYLAIKVKALGNIRLLSMLV